MIGNDYVWYACYGSNLSLNRFLCYILGDKIPGTNTTEQGCNDTSLPIKDKTILLNHEILFVEHSKKWENKGVAILDDRKKVHNKTFSRMYLIKKDQFLDVVKQENGIDVKTKITVTFPLSKSENTSIIFENNLYGKLFFIGMSENYPIYTFTSSKPINSLTIHKPSDKYLLMLANGLRESFGLNDNEIANYFISLKGADLFTYEGIRNIIKQT